MHASRCQQPHDRDRRPAAVRPPLDAVPFAGRAEAPEWRFRPLKTT